MEKLKVSLCPSCSACPEVEIIGDEVRVGEIGNLAVLKKDDGSHRAHALEKWRLLLKSCCTDSLTCCCAPA